MMLPVDRAPGKVARLGPAIAAGGGAIGACLLAHAGRGSLPLAAAILLAALATLGHRALPPLASSLASPRHLGSSLALAALAVALGPVPGSIAGAIAQVGWAWAHRGAFAIDRGELTPREERLALGSFGVAALGLGVPASLWLLPVVLDGPRLLEALIASCTSRFQRIAVTREGEVVRLWIDGFLQLSSDDEHVYHETLVHPALALAVDPSRALVLGGGDGLVARELLRCRDVERIVVVDLDRAMTRAARDLPALARLGGASLDDPRVELRHEDALAFLARESQRFGVIVFDLPDPTSEILARLYARETFVRIRARLAPGGVLAVQAGSPRTSAHAFASIVRSVEAAGMHVLLGAVDEPRSFGGTAVVLGSERALAAPTALRTEPRWLDARRLAAMFAPRAELTPVDADVTTLDHPAVLRYLRRATAALAARAAGSR